MEEYLSNLGKNSIYYNDYKLVESYDITEWNPKGLTDEITGGVITIVAPTGSGKTVLLRNIVADNQSKFKKVYLVCPTAKLQNCYSWINPIEKYSTEFMNDILETRRKDQNDDKVLIILDDIIDDPDFKKCPVMESFAIGARHLGVYVIVLSQDFNSIKPIIRKNTRIAISFELPSKKERQKFTESYMSLENNHIGELLYRKITGVRYQCVVVLNYVIGEALDKKVKSFIAEPKKCPKKIEERTEKESKQQKELKGLRKLFLL